MSRVLLIGSAALILFCAASPSVAAAPAGNPPLIPVGGWMAGVLNQLQNGHPKEARAALDAHLKNETDPQTRAVAHALRAVANGMLNDQPAMRIDMAEAISLAKDPAPFLVQQIQLGSRTDQGMALEGVARLAAIDPAKARELDEGVIWTLLQGFREAHRTTENERLVLILADLYFGQISSPDEFQKQAAVIMVARGDAQRALEYARRVNERAGLIDILTDRRYQQLWPELEQSSGVRLEIPARARLARADADFQAHPDSLALRLNLMRAYVDVGDLQEADKVGVGFGRTREELMSLTGTTAYVVDEHADILSMLGKAEEADRRRAALVETWSDSRRWIISMAINRLAALFTAHRYEEVLRELDRPNRRYQQDSSPYAKQLLRVLRVGSLIGLGRRPEALALIPELQAHKADARAATVDALMLAGMDDEAEKLVLAALENIEEREVMIQSLRISDSSPKADDPLAETIRVRLRARPDVESAFQKYARDLPETLRRTY